MTSSPSLFVFGVGFTALAGRLDPAATAALLNRVFTRFDALCHEHGVEKIKTIGDGYMVACGVPVPEPDHALRVIAFARAALEAITAEPGLQLRVGVHSGPLVAGVLGLHKFSYDLWGDTANLASRMESGGLEGCIQVSEAVREALGDRFVFEARGRVPVKGKGELPVWLLLGEREP